MKRLLKNRGLILPRVMKQRNFAIENDAIVRDVMFCVQFKRKVCLEGITVDKNIKRSPEAISHVLRSLYIRAKYPRKIKRSYENILHNVSFSTFQISNLTQPQRIKQMKLRKIKVQQN